MPRRAQNNPRQVRVKTCGCSECTLRFRPDEKPTRRSCTGPWQARYRDPGGKQKAKTFPTEREALTFLDSIRSTVRTGTYIDPKRSAMTLSQWHAMWEPTRHVGETTRQRTEIDWRTHVEPAFGSWPMHTIGYLDVEEWKQRLSKRLAPSGVRKILAYLRRMLQAAVRDRRIPFNPAEAVAGPPDPGKHPDDLLPPDGGQVNAIRAELHPFYRPLVTFKYETGLRWGELTGLRGCWLDLPDRRLQVREVLVELTAPAGERNPNGGGNRRLVRKPMPKSSAGFRTVPLTAAAVEAAEEHLAERKRRGRPPLSRARTQPGEGLHPEELVWRGPQDGAYSRNNFLRPWHRAIKDAGVARQVVNPQTGRTEWWPTPHDLRHAFASRLHAQGVPEVVVQRLMGHERGGQVTWLYTHGSQEDLLDAIRRLDGGDQGRHLRAV